MVELDIQIGKIIAMSDKYSDEWFLSLYLKYGSVEEAIRSFPESLPISTANYHRLVKKYGLIKSAGRHVSLPETLHFFREKAMTPGAPLERIYKEMPLSFQTSLSTLHRIYQYMERQMVRRHAVALIITNSESNANILIGKEVFGNSRYGKKVGDFSIPMSFAKEDERTDVSVLRVLQQEVFSGLAQNGKMALDSQFAKHILPSDLAPFAYFDIVDVRVKVYHLCVSLEFEKYFQSYKLTNHHFVDINDASAFSLRLGVSEIINIYRSYLNNSFAPTSPNYFVASVNKLALA